MENPFNLTFKLSSLRLLGPNLYGNIPAVLSELIANAWDADAKRVDITIDVQNKYIEIEDNGIGMSSTDINDHYLSIGYEKRKSKENRYTALKRHVLGRKGIGKLAIFSFAKLAEIHTVSSTGRSGFILDWDSIEQQFDKDNYYPVPLDPCEIIVNHETGTRIVLKEISTEKLDIVNNEKKLRMYLARRFSLLDGRHDYDVYINGKMIGISDRYYYDSMEFLWNLDTSSDISAHCPKLKKVFYLPSKEIPYDENYQFVVKGWVGTVDVPSSITNDKNNTIAIYANGRLIHENLLSSFPDITARTFATYLIGEIQADILDNDDLPDIIIANRREISQDDSRFKAIQTYIADCVLSVISSKWTTLRNLVQIDPRLMTDEIQELYGKLNVKDQEKSSSFIKRLNKIKLPEHEEQEFAVLIFNHLDEIKKVKGLISRSDELFLQELRSFSKDSSNETTGDHSRSSTESNSDNNGMGNESSETESNKTEQPKNEPEESSNGKTNKEQIPTKPVFDFEEEREQNPSDTFKFSSPPIKEREAIFQRIKSIIEKSKMSADLKSVALYDLRQAYGAYCKGAYKASCVMFGAVLEGVMITVIANEKLISGIRLAGNAHKKLLECEVNNTATSIVDVIKKIEEKFTFEDYKNVISKLISDEPEADRIKINEVQMFRNIIHPLKNITGIEAFKDIDSTRALNLLSSMEIICKILTKMIQ